MSDKFDGFILQYNNEQLLKAIESWENKDDDIHISEEKEDVIQFHLEKEMIRNMKIQKYYSSKGWHV